MDNKGTSNEKAPTVSKNEIDVDANLFVLARCIARLLTVFELLDVVVLLEVLEQRLALLVQAEVGALRQFLLVVADLLDDLATHLAEVASHSFLHTEDELLALETRNYRADWIYVL